ncbi:MAG: DUF1302 domain-containing protein [Spongiibacter marinus]|uniref:DUF1302 domain-containing protein n=1 Tax=Spongiibacter marinus TaxID=354246 RepID=UPI003C4B3CD4
MANTSAVGSRRYLAVCISALTLGVPIQSQALTFNWGEVEGSFNSTLSLGASWRAGDPDEDYLSPGNTDGKGRASVSTTDDGNLNYDKGDMYSLLFKGVHDLELSLDNIGLFTRFKYWYDYALAEGDVAHGHVPNNYRVDGTLETEGFDDLAQSQGAEFLDYYLYGNFELGSAPVELRAGNMVLSWGESTFIQNGVNIISPFDVTALHRPGSEIKEALLPVGLLYANIGVTAELSIEAFYQYEWKRTVLEGCGTYWSSADVYGGGCDKLTLSTAAPDADQVAAGGFMPRAADDEAGDSGQWGIAGRYFFDWLGGTEIGAYYVNYHSRTPILSGINATSFSPLTGQPENPQYFFEFPEDIEVYALTFATNLGLWAVSGEVSYRPELPLQINTVEISQTLALGSLNEWSRIADRGAAAGPGGVVHGFDNVEYTQAQMTFIRFFEQVMGADRLAIAAEVGGVWIGGMNEAINYGRSATFGIGDFEPINSGLPLPPAILNLLPPLPGIIPVSCDSHPVLSLLAGVQPNSQPQNCTDDGFVEDFSWGYRVRARLTYSDVFKGVNLTPNMAWSHDVSGYSPPPNFIEGRQALSIGLSADYLSTYQADISYTNYFGADYNDQQDRDFISLSFSVAF